MGKGIEKKEIGLELEIMEVVNIKIGVWKINRREHETAGLKQRFSAKPLYLMFSAVKKNQCI